MKRLRELGYVSCDEVRREVIIKMKSKKRVSFSFDVLSILRLAQ